MDSIIGYRFWFVIIFINCCCCCLVAYFLVFAVDNKNNTTQNDNGENNGTKNHNRNNNQEQRQQYDNVIGIIDVDAAEEDNVTATTTDVPPSPTIIDTDDPLYTSRPLDTASTSQYIIDDYHHHHHQQQLSQLEYYHTVAPTPTPVVVPESSLLVSNQASEYTRDNNEKHIRLTPNNNTTKPFGTYPMVANFEIHTRDDNNNSTGILDEERNQILASVQSVTESRNIENPKDDNLNQHNENRKVVCSNSYSETVLERINNSNNVIDHQQQGDRDITISRLSMTEKSHESNTNNDSTILLNPQWNRNSWTSSDSTIVTIIDENNNNKDNHLLDPHGNQNNDVSASLSSSHSTAESNHCHPIASIIPVVDQQEQLSSGSRTGKSFRDSIPQQYRPSDEDNNNNREHRKPEVDQLVLEEDNVTVTNNNNGRLDRIENTTGSIDDEPSSRLGLYREIANERRKELLKRRLRRIQEEELPHEKKRKQIGT